MPTTELWGSLLGRMKEPKVCLEEAERSALAHGFSMSVSHGFPVFSMLFEVFPSCFFHDFDRCGLILASCPLLRGLQRLQERCLLSCSHLPEAQELLELLGLSEHPAAQPCRQGGLPGLAALQQLVAALYGRPTGDAQHLAEALQGEEWLRSGLEATPERREPRRELAVPWFWADFHGFGMVFIGFEGQRACF